MTDNAALIAILEELRTLNESAAGRYDSVIGTNSQSVSSVAPFTRAATPTSVKVAVTNISGATARIYESDKLVSLLPVGDTWESPLSGQAEIKIDTASASIATIAIATYIKA